MRGRKESCSPIQREKADMAAERNSSFVQISEAIQNLPPELIEMILKEFIAIKIKEKKEMGWGKVHEHISKLPVYEFKQQIVRMAICMDYANCYFEGCCFPCFENEGTVHNALVRPPNNDPEYAIEADPDYNNFLEACPWNGYDWHERFLFW